MSLRYEVSKLNHTMQPTNFPRIAISEYPISFLIVRITIQHSKIYMYNYLRTSTIQELSDTFHAVLEKLTNQVGKLRVRRND